MRNVCGSFLSPPLSWTNSSFSKRLDEKMPICYNFIRITIYLLDLGGLSLWIRKLHIMNRQAVKIH